MSVITESELVLPSLYLMMKNRGSITTTTLIKNLTELMNPSGIDIEILSKRRDTHFSQKVRNLKCHDTLKKRGYATHTKWGFDITPKGLAFVEKNINAIKYLVRSDFDYTDIKTTFGNITSNPKRTYIPVTEIISEGTSQVVTAIKRSRSARLRSAAIEHFTQNGIIKCDCCGFEFSQFYGKKYGEFSCIEIHHIRPIFAYLDQDFTTTISNALSNLLPVCPNCHRVIHKKHIYADELDAFRQSINTQKSQTP